MNEWLHDSHMKDIAFKAVMIILSLLLQKPSQKLKSREHSERLKTVNTSSTVAKIFKKFSREIYKGNVTNAVKLLTVNMQNGFLS